MVLEDGETTGIAHPAQFSQELDGGKIWVFLDTLGQVGCKRVDLGGADDHHAGGRGVFERQRATDSFTVQVEFSGNVCPGKFVHFEKTSDGGPEIRIHERYST